MRRVFLYKFEMHFMRAKVTVKKTQFWGNLVYSLSEVIKASGFSDQTKIITNPNPHTIFVCDADSE